MSLDIGSGPGGECADSGLRFLHVADMDEDPVVGPVAFELESESVEAKQASTNEGKKFAGMTGEEEVMYVITGRPGTLEAW
jgi:hypothetical protein